MPRILIADDDGITRHLLRLLLREHDYDVVGEASDGEAVRELCDVLQPDMICLDINMPKMSGLEVLCQIRSLHPRTAIVMISASATHDNVRAALANGADGFIVKPFKAASVIDTIEGCIDARGRRLKSGQPQNGGSIATGTETDSQ